MSKTERLQQKMEELCGASIRALSTETSFRFRGHRFFLKGRPLSIPVPHLHIDLEHDDYSSMRGAADGVALRLVFNDSAIHKALCPQDRIQRLIFELLEQLRVQSLVPEKLPGVKRNVDRRFLCWAAQMHVGRITENHVGMLIYSLAMTCWSRLTGEQTPEEIEGLIETTRAALSGVIGRPLAMLRRERKNQERFGQHALVIAETLGQMINDSINDQNNEEASLETLAKSSGISLDWLDFEGEGVELDSGVHFEQSTPGQSDSLYKIYTEAYDTEVEASSLVRPEQLKRLRQNLDRSAAGQGINIPRLAGQLKRMLSTPRLSGWSFGEEEGLLDAARLSRLLTSPDYRQLFKQERSSPHTDCLVTLLIDNSGSMRQYVEYVAILVDIFSRALEMAGAKTEVLGFTTGCWNGGKPYREWRANGRPKDPGRLSEVSHRIYKSADTPWRLGRQGIAALLKPDLFREGIDGEALEWAALRMTQRSEHRRILIAISDGSPMESATQIANGEHYLDSHLQRVANEIEKECRIALCALGVGLDLSPYYSHSLSLDLSKALDNSIFTEVMQLLDSAIRQAYSRA